MARSGLVSLMVSQKSWTCLREDEKRIRIDIRGLLITRGLRSELSCTIKVSSGGNERDCV